MNRRQFLLLVVAGVCASVGAVVVTVVGLEQLAPGLAGATTAESDPDWTAWLVALGGLVVAAWLLWDRSGSRSPDEESLTATVDPIRPGTPEATDRQHPLTGGELVDALVAARELAREERDADAGLSVVRPLLREAFTEISARNHRVPDPETALDDGTWTDDQVAAAALSADVTPPSRSLGRRLRDWLYPGRAVTRSVGRAVDALAAVADGSVPPVVGQAAPRQVPVHESSLAARRLRADGRVPTTNPTRGDHPARPHRDDESAVGEEDDVSGEWAAGEGAERGGAGEGAEGEGAEGGGSPS